MQSTAGSTEACRVISSRIWRKSIVPSASAVVSEQQENLVYARNPVFSMFKEYGMALYGTQIMSKTWFFHQNTCVWFLMSYRQQQAFCILVGSFKWLLKTGMGEF